MAKMFRKILKPGLSHSAIGNRQFWEWVNIVFNKVDEDRLKLNGPDRTCAEWLLRNGGAVKWSGHTEFLRNYNRLPKEGGPHLTIKEVDATNSSIMHYGFPHFAGCDEIEKIILHQCTYIEDEALKYLYFVQKSLTFLQVSSCRNVTSAGLMHLDNLNKLNRLVIYDLPYVTDEKELLKHLGNKLPTCKIDYK